MTPTRILALHGYHGSADVLRRQIAPLAAALPSEVELVLVDAPSLSQRDFGWWHEGFRGWGAGWTRLPSSSVADASTASSGSAKERHWRGCSLAAQDPTRPASLRFEFAVMVGGFTSFEPQHAALFGRKLTMPSIHVAGTARRHRADPRFAGTRRSVRRPHHPRTSGRTRHPERPDTHARACALIAGINSATARQGSVGRA